MSKHEIDGESQKCFIPSLKLRDYLSKRLQVTKQMDKIYAAGEEIPPEIFGSDRGLRTTKVRILNDIVFQAMADLTFFFECIKEHQELRNIFDNDVQDLLGLRRNTSESQRAGYMFSRLIRSILITDEKIGLKKVGIRRSKDVKDYRLILTDLLQQSVQDKVRGTLSDAIWTPEARKNVLDDFGRVRGWTIDLKHGADQNMTNRIPHRIFGFGSGELLK